jgi:hypothetical protein
MADKSAQVRLAECIAKYSPEVRAVAEAALKKMRGRLPGAVETVYDNYNALAIAFGPTDRRSDVVCSITLYPRWVSLFFARGASLPDPQKILKGSGTTVRHILLEDASILDQPAVRALVTQAVKAAGTRFDTSAARQVVIKSVARTRRPRRPASAASRSARSAR